MSHKILLVGNYNAGNFGDDLLLTASEIGLKNVFSNAEILVMAPKKPREYPLPPAGLRSLMSFNIFRSIKGFKKADFVVFGGGGLFNSEVPYSIFIWKQVVNFARFFKKPIYLLGQSFSTKLNRAISSILNKVELVTVRDNISFTHLQKLALNCPVRLTTDIAFLLDKSHFNFSDIVFDDREFVVLNLRNYPGLRSQALMDVADQIINFITKNSSYSVFLLPFSADDNDLLYSIWKSHKDNGKVLLLPHDNNTCLSAISNCRAVISSRLHPAIAGLINQKPVLALSYSSKVFGLFKDLSLDDHCLDLRDLAYSDIDNKIETLLSFVKRNISLLSDTELNVLQKKAQSNFEYLKTMI